MFCNKCGKKINDNATFCPFCGNKKDVYDSNINTTPIINAKPKKKSKAPIIILIVTLIIVAVFVVFVIARNSGSSKKSSAFSRTDVNISGGNSSVKSDDYTSVVMGGYEFILPKEYTVDYPDPNYAFCESEKDTGHFIIQLIENISAEKAYADPANAFAQLLWKAYPKIGEDELYPSRMESMNISVFGDDVYKALLPTSDYSIYFFVNSSRNEAYFITASLGKGYKEIEDILSSSNKIQIVY